MRETHIHRLKGIKIDINNIFYLHYNYYHQDLFDAFNKYVKGKLLDIGCGNKPYQDILAERTIEYIGCDIIQSSEDCVDILCPANQIPLGADTFDTVISTQTIEHVEDHQGLVNEAFRLVKKDGYFILSCPMYWPLHEEPYDFFRFTKYGLTYILEKAGFKIISLNANGGKWSVAGQAFLHALYPHVNSITGIKGKMIRGFINIIGGVKTINKFFIFLDGKATDHSNTMNYVVVCQKP